MTDIVNRSGMIVYDVRSPMAIVLVCSTMTEMTVLMLSAERGVAPAHRHLVTTVFLERRAASLIDGTAIPKQDVKLEATNNTFSSNALSSLLLPS